MARTIVVDFEGARSSFGFRKLERSTLYGKRKRVAIDSKGQPCQRAALTRDGRFLLQAGMTAQGYVTQDGRWVPNAELVGLDERQEPVELHPSTLGVPQSMTLASAQELLDLHVTTTYLLSVEELATKVADELNRGALFRFGFNYRSDYRCETAFLLASEEGYFVVVGVPAPPQWIEPGFRAEEIVEDDDDDELDFEMF